MAIQNKLYICFGVQLDPQYEYTICPHSINSDAHSKYTPYPTAFYKYILSRASWGISGADVSYIRESSNSLKVNIPKDKLEGANYLLFDNVELPDYKGEKARDIKHYAFIDELEYINDNCTRIRFSIDVLSTWLPYLSIESATVKREHIDYDGIGQNIQREPFELSNYFPVQVNAVTDLASSTKYYAVIAVTAAQAGLLTSKSIVGSSLEFNYSKDYQFDTFIHTPEEGSNQYIESQFPISFNGGVSGMSYWLLHMDPDTFDNPYSETVGDKILHRNDLYWLISYISMLRNTLNSEIYGAWLIPENFLKGQTLEYYQLIGGNTVLLESAIIGKPDDNGNYKAPKYGFLKNISSINAIKQSIAVSVNSLVFDSPHKGSYTAINKKMLNYPFKRLVISTPNNDTIIEPEILYQDADSDYGTVNCNMVLVFSPEPELVINIPNSRYYAGKSVASLRPFLKLNFSLNTQQARDLEKEVGYTQQAISGALAGASSKQELISSAAASGVYSAAYVAKQYWEYELQERVPPANNGVISDQAIFVARQLTSQSISFFSMYMDYIDAENAEKCDKFFTAYGYATNKIKQPNLFIEHKLDEDGKVIETWKKHCRIIVNYLQATDCVITTPTSILGGVRTWTAFGAEDSGPTLVMPPAEDLIKIKQILAKGITVWMDPSYVGNYNATDIMGVTPLSNRYRFDRTSVDEPVA